MIKDGECGVFNPLVLECFLRIEPDVNDLYEAMQAEGIEA